MERVERVSKQPTAEAQEDARQEELMKLQEEANNTANQGANDGSVEVQDKLSVPRVEVVKRGYVKHTDKDGNLVKELADVDDDREEAPVPEYILLHERVLNGEEPLEAQRSFEALQDEKVVKKSVTTARTPQAVAEPVKDESDAK